MESAYLAVARFHKPHGLKGEAVVWVLTDEPERVLVPDRTLTPVDDGGDPIGTPLTIERARSYHRQWLLKFREIGDRTTLEQWDQKLLGMARRELTPPRNDEMYAHEIPGARVMAGGDMLGVAKGLLGVPGGELLAVDVDGKEVLVPFREPILRGLNREERVIEVDLPPGLLEL